MDMIENKQRKLFEVGSRYRGAGSPFMVGVEFVIIENRVCNNHEMHDAGRCASCLNHAKREIRYLYNGESRAFTRPVCTIPKGSYRVLEVPK